MIVRKKRKLIVISTALLCTLSSAPLLSCGKKQLWFVGSRYFISSLSEEQKEEVMGVINVDTVAQESDLGYWIMVGEGQSKEEDGNFTFEPVENTMSRLFTTNDRFQLTCQMNSDHYPFSMAGIPAISIVQNVEEGTLANSSQDTIETIDPKRLGEIARILSERILDLKIENTLT